MSKLNLSAGDKVIIKTRFDERIGTVEKITPKGFIKVAGVLYTEYGSERTSDVWCRNHIKPATDEDVKRVTEANYIKRAINVMQSHTDISYDQAKAIMQILLPEGESKDDR